MDHMPLFTAEASVYKTRRPYRGARAWGEGSGALVHMGGAVSSPADTCKPHCGRCDSDPFSYTGCSRVCMMPNCEVYDAPCHGCPGECKSCDPSNGCCSGVCTDLSSDPNHCGSCAIRCSPGQSCSNGVCGIVCPPGLTFCGGKCADLSSDPSNCGGCGLACAPGSPCCLGGCGTLCPNGGCCPAGYPNCCPDGTHCCPAGTHCGSLFGNLICSPL
jgi:hypothetical protein